MGQECHIGTAICTENYKFKVSGASKFLYIIQGTSVWPMAKYPATVSNNNISIEDFNWVQMLLI